MSSNLFAWCTAFAVLLASITIAGAQSTDDFLFYDMEPFEDPDIDDTPVPPPKAICGDGECEMVEYGICDEDCKPSESQLTQEYTGLRDLESQPQNDQTTLIVVALALVLIILVVALKVMMPKTKKKARGK